jgi:hypothetical protein
MESGDSSAFGQAHNRIDYLAYGGDHRFYQWRAMRRWDWLGCDAQHRPAAQII